MEKYRGMVEAALKFVEEYAKTTEATWDDAAVSVARTVLLAFFGDERVPMASSMGEQALSPTVLALVLEVLRLFWSLRK